MFRKSWVLALGLALVPAVSIAQEQVKKGEMSNINTYPDCTLVAGNLVANCRFDTSDFTGWMQGGDPSFQNVISGCGHSGSFCASMGSVSYNGTLTQSIATTGPSCSLSFWLGNSGQPSHFGVQWNAHQVMDLYYIPNLVIPANYTQFSVSGLPGGGAAYVTFEFYNPPAFIQFTDVVVTCP